MFVVGKLLWLLTRPGGLLTLCLLAGLALHRRGPRISHALLTLGVLSFVGFLDIPALPLDHWVLAPLENRFPVPEAPARVDGIILLGGAVNANMADGQPILISARERMTEFLVLARRYPNARLLFTGGSGSIWLGAPSEAAVAQQFSAQQGLDVKRVSIEGASRSTWENALFSRNLVQPCAGETWILITSASHMPRAVGVFRRLGWKVLPWPVDYKTDNVRTIDLAPHLALLDTALHEWAGLLDYRLMGHTDTLLPGPE